MAACFCLRAFAHDVLPPPPKTRLAPLNPSCLGGSFSPKQTSCLYHIASSHASEHLTLRIPYSLSCSLSVSPTGMLIHQRLGWDCLVHCPSHVPRLWPRSDGLSGVTPSHQAPRIKSAPLFQPHVCLWPRKQGTRADFSGVSGLGSCPVGSSGWSPLAL